MKSLVVKFIGSVINLISYVSPRTAGNLAMKLFSSPRKIKIKEIEKDFLDTAYKQELNYDNLSISTYRWLGEKDTILLAHGWESNSFRWKALIENLTTLKYNVIALDAPAHGNSSGKTFNAILYAECIHLVAQKFEANIIIGHSVGGMAAAFSHSKYQLPSVNKLVFLGAPSNFVGVFSRYVNMMGYNSRLSTTMNELILERFNEKPDHFNAARFMEHTEIEGLIIHDESDTIIPFNDAEDFKNHFKTAKLIATNGFGHGLKSVEVNNHILEFINP